MIFITDTALEQIERSVLCHEPERGGAIMGVPGRPVITDFVWDADAATTSSSYRPSTGLTARVQEAERLGLEHKGILHSHPAAMSSPSGQDLTAFADSLRRNPHLGEYLVPIGNTVLLDETPSRIVVDAGTVSFWSARLNRDGELECVETDVSVIPIGDLATRVADGIGGSVSEPAGVMMLDGRPMIGVAISTGDEIVHLIVSDAFPVTAPVILVEQGDKLDEVPLNWQLSASPADQVADAVTAFCASRGLSDAEDLEPASADACDQLMVRSQGLLPSDLQNRSVLVVGAGSVGSWLADGLVRSGVGHVTVVEPDVVESNNVGRTAYGWADVGSSKVAALERHLRAINPTIEFGLIAEAVEPGDAEWLAAKISQSDLVVAATDDPVAQRIVNRYAFHEGTPAVYPGIYKGAAGGEVVIAVPHETPCFQCATSIRHASTSDGQAVHASTDYGTGRLEGEVGLHADIAHVTTAALKICLAALSRGTSARAANFAESLLGEGATYLVMGMEPDYWFFDEVFASTPGQFAFQSVWMTPESDLECPTCGDPEHRSDPCAEPLSRPGADLVATALCATTSGGRSRTFAMPTVRDRVAQRAALDVCGRVLDKYQMGGSFAYRRGRSWLDALRKVERHRDQGLAWVYRCDIRDFFGSVDHTALAVILECLLHHPSDVEMLMGWVSAPRVAVTGTSSGDRGLPLGLTISGALANAFLMPFDLGVNRSGRAIVRYADDTVVLCRSEAEARQAQVDCERALCDLGLEANGAKSFVTNFDRGFSFLGWTFFGAHGFQTDTDRAWVHPLAFSGSSR